MRRMQPHRPSGLLVAWLAYAAFVVYGSLVPLDFQPRPWDEALRLFQHIRLLDVGTQGRADWIANGVLYLPLAFLTAQVLAGGRQRPSALALVTALLFCLTLAVTVEFVQLYFPPRTVSLNDLLAEGIGSLLGVGLAAAWGGRFRRLLALAGDPGQLPLRLLKAYAVAYIAFGLFPFDFLVSVTEIAAKSQSGAWGWFFARDAWHGSLGLTLAKLVGEALATVPLGVLAYRLRPPWSAASALAAGAFLGLLIELAQFFIVSGVSQGLSLVTRALGLYTGVLLGRRAGLLPPSRIAAIARRHAVAAGALYLLALATVNGWFEQRWTDMEHAARTFAELRFLPFYYHYYTTEQAALLSLTAVGLMYAPIGLLTWATWSPPALALLLASLAAGVMEASKLFLDGLRPDPTNVLLAGLAAWATAHLARRLSMAARMSRPATALQQAAAETAGSGQRIIAGETDQAGAGRPPPRDRATLSNGSLPRTPSWRGLVLAVVGLAVVAWGVAAFPFEPLLLGLMLGGYAALIWRHPQAIWVVLPAALPLLDLAPWSGRFLFDEFDLLLLITLSVGYARVPPVSRRARPDLLLHMVLMLLALSYTVGLARGLPPLQWPDLNAFSHYYSGFNAMRVGKGAVWAFLLFGLLRRLQAFHRDWGLRLAQGMTLGLAGTAAVVLWERLAFPGLANFADVYRVTGPFSQMHTGGADLETQLTLSLPFLLYLMFTRRGWLTKTAGSVLLVAATYAMMVSFARIGYAAYALAMLLTLSMLLLQAWPHRVGGLPHRPAIAVVALSALTVAVAWPIWHGPFTQARLARSGADLELRLKHWQASLEMRDPGWATAAFGMGLGRYPQTHAFRSEGERAATYRLESEGGNVFLRLGSGSPLYVEQFVAIRPGQEYRLSLDLRSPEPGTALNVSLCEKWLLTSARCEFLRLDVPLVGAWVGLETRIGSGDVGNTPWYAPRPVKLSLYNAEAGKVVEVDRVSLRTADGLELVSNGDFARGMDRWFFSVDNDLPWHIWSLPVSLLFDLGWLGLSAHALFFALALARSGHAAWQGDPLAGVLLAALAGYLVLGSMDSLMDSPRMLLAGLLFAWLAARPDRDVRSRPELAPTPPAQGQLE